MRLYVFDKNGKKITLSLRANSRSELFYLLGGGHFNFGDGEIFSVNQVRAERDSENHLNAAVGGILGGLVGILAGPAGVVIGAGIGGALGNNKDLTEQASIDNFNNSSASW